MIINRIVKGGSALPTITLTISQVISQDPLTVQLTQEQIDIIEGVEVGGGLLVDATAFELGTPMMTSVDGYSFAIVRGIGYTDTDPDEIGGASINVVFYNPTDGTLTAYQSNNLIDTYDATATAEDIASGKTAYVDGVKITGAIPSKVAATYTPTTTDQSIAAGQYLAGAQTIAGDANLVSGNIKSGVSVFGVTGTLPSEDTTFNELLSATYGTVPTVTTISFTIGRVEYTAEEGMTWGEWVVSEYNTDGFVADIQIWDSTTTAYVVYQDIAVSQSDEIVENRAYYVDAIPVPPRNK